MPTCSVYISSTHSSLSQYFNGPKTWALYGVYTSTVEHVLLLQSDISCDSPCVSYCRLAEGYYKQALQMFESAYGEESPQVLKVRRYFVQQVWALCL